MAAPPDLGAAFERLMGLADRHGEGELLLGGLELARDISGADACRLHAVRGDLVVELGSLDRHGGTARREAVPLEWFPWGLAPVNPRHYLFVPDARSLPSRRISRPGDELESPPAASCLHLPISERQRAVGALHLSWSTPRVEWDDGRGPLLRLLGGYLLGRCGGGRRT